MNHLALADRTCDETEFFNFSFHDILRHISVLNTSAILIFENLKKIYMPFMSIWGQLTSVIERPIRSIFLLCCTAHPNSLMFFLKLGKM